MLNYYREIREKLKKDVNDMAVQFPGFAPGLAIVQVGTREDSNVYIRMKIKAASEIGIKAQHVQLSKNISEAQLLMKVLFILYCLNVVQCNSNKYSLQL